MARPRTFDEDAVLTAAMHAFRREGYAGSSVPSLEVATGLRASSLYNAFGDKAGLFRRALDHYVATFVAPRLVSHAGPDATLEDLEVLFTTIFDPPFDDGHGCLVTNSVLGLGHGSEAAAGVELALDLVTTHCTGVVRRELGDDAEAAGLTLLYQGILVLARAGRLDDSHRTAVHLHFDKLRQLRDTRREKRP
jgi:TetR/AcrR family transcriptional regulator, transcriptional repressor for nem operon